MRREYLSRAVACLREDGKVSALRLQRKLGIAFNRAESLIVQMRMKGLIKPDPMFKRLPVFVSADSADE